LDQYNKKFEQVDKRFEQIEVQLVEFRKDTLHQFCLVSEDLKNRVHQVAEGVTNLNEKFDRRIDEIRKKIEEKHQDVLGPR